MSDVKWIKITTDIFDDEKIKIIDKLPARDEILVIWFKLLALAGKSNNNGLLFMANKIPYTLDMLSAVFSRESISIENAIHVFQKFNMINVENNEVIAITNWDKHQNIDSLEKIKEQSKLRVARHREKQKLLACNVTCNATVTQSNAIDIDKEIEIDIDKKHSKKHSQKELLVASLPADFSEGFKNTICDFIEHRKNIKKPMTERALKLLVNELKRLSNSENERIAILNQSILNGWQSVFELKQKLQTQEQSRYKSCD
jgi:predicted phage replisome organizer